MALLAEDDNTSRLPLRRPNNKSSVWTDDNRKGSPEGGKRRIIVVQVNFVCPDSLLKCSNRVDVSNSSAKMLLKNFISNRLYQLFM